MIWQQEISIDELNQRGKNTLSDFLGITFTAVSESSLTASVTIKKEHLQPAGVVHGGFNCLLAETVGSAAGNYCVPKGSVAYGLDIHTNHIRAVKEGQTVIATAKPLHNGRSTQVWEIQLTVDEALTSVSRLTLFVK